MSIQPVDSKAITSSHSYTDSRGTFLVGRLFEWINKHPEKHKYIPLDHLLKYISEDSWSDFNELQRTNFRTVFEDEKHFARMKKANLTYPIIIDNFNQLIDGVHRVFKAVFEKKEKIKAVFINQSQLNSISTSLKPSTKKSQVEKLPIEDVYLTLDSKSLPKDEDKKRGIIEDYFPDHLPTATLVEGKFEVCLERPSSPYGSFGHDKAIKPGLDWWKKGTRIRDICVEYKGLNKGMLALEEQWIPLAWSNAFKALGEIPEEIVLLHLDDHQDMMSPRIGKRIDGEMIDYITGEHIDFMDPATVKSAIKSGAIGKGSILTPLIWSIPKIHVRHLTFRPHPNTTYKIDRVTYEDKILFKKDNRIGLHFTDTSWESLTHQSNYVVTSDYDTWLKDIPADVPILLHFDLDYFNNRFDGSSSWEEDLKARSFNPDFQTQEQCLKKVINGISRRKIESRIIDTTIGISPGFYPAEFWRPMVNNLFKELSSLGINLNKEGDMSNKSCEKSEKGEKKTRKLADLGLTKSPNLRETIKKPKIASINDKPSLEDKISIKKMASKKFDGWKVIFENKPCGFVKFFPKFDKVFNEHVTVYFHIPIPQRGKHIGRSALKLAIESSVHKLFVAHLSKKNIASRKALQAVGFIEEKYPGIKQLCMVFRK